MRRTVLLVDDDPTLARTYAAGLGMEGFAVTVAGSGEAALEMVPGGAYDVILLDLSLPGIDGLAVLRVLRERNLVGPPVVLMFSNFSDLGLIDAARELGAAAWVYKLATSPPTLAAKIRELLPSEPAQS